MAIPAMLRMVPAITWASVGAVSPPRVPWCKICHCLRV